MRVALITFSLENDAPSNDNILSFINRLKLILNFVIPARPLRSEAELGSALEGKAGIFFIYLFFHI